ncbi:serine hydrolase domain-containing protein [Rathayibacter toxicus]|uniref:serine hydrolase domain-containing protein n=1 Tax=Rathayibacter toxicus TaxID=145458 RepID=UPI000CE787AD|nr:serine hydrolase domain-containing protein [Rathayibacter toxicus]PPI56687.1 serine hydrolase [Rathayibacter toxicus]QOD10555.1 beta-lactamase family protein [Rathayibacter toxicus]
MKRGRVVALASTAGILILLGGRLLFPSTPHLAEERTGDAEIARWLHENAGEGIRHQLTAAVVTPGSVRFGGLGADEQTEVEIGSVTKTMTALLLAQSVARGTVALDDRASDYAALGDFPGTLEELASHRSGLPRLSSDPRDAAVMLFAQLRGKDPYATFSPDDVVNHAAHAALSERGTVSYSNLGAAVLGQILARVEGQDLSGLFRDRLFLPLGMVDTFLPVTADALRPDAPTGYSARGRPVAPWTLGGYAPAGGARSTAADMARYAQALLSSSPALGVSAATVLDPRFDAGESRTGLAWFTSSAAGGTTTWHNGGTAGYSTMLALDREHGIAVFVNGNTALSVDELGLRLLEHVRGGVGG